MDGFQFNLKIKYFYNYLKNKSINIKTIVFINLNKIL